MELWSELSFIVGAGVLVIVFGLAFAVLWQIFRNRIDLSMLIAEPDNKASLSRFQLLVFTFVIAGIYLLLCIESGSFVEVPASVLGLLGISSGSYVIAKGIKNQPGGGAESTEVVTDERRVSVTARKPKLRP